MVDNLHNEFVKYFQLEHGSWTTTHFCDGSKQHCDCDGVKDSRFRCQECYTDIVEHMTSSRSVAKNRWLSSGPFLALIVFLVMVGFYGSKGWLHQWSLERAHKLFARNNNPETQPFQAENSARIKKVSNAFSDEQWFVWAVIVAIGSMPLDRLLRFIIREDAEEAEVKTNVPLLYRMFERSESPLAVCMVELTRGLTQPASDLAWVVSWFWKARGDEADQKYYNDVAGKAVRFTLASAGALFAKVGLLMECCPLLFWKVYAMMYWHGRDSVEAMRAAQEICGLSECCLDEGQTKQILNSHFVNLLGYVGLLTGVVASAAMTAAKRLVFGIANAGCERDHAANRQLASQGKHTRALATFTRLAFTRDALDQHIKKGGKVPQSINDNPLLMQQHATQLPTRRGRKAKNANKTVANQVTRPFPLYYQSKSKERREFLEARKRAKQQEQGPEGQQQLVVHSNESHSGLVARLRGGKRRRRSTITRGKSSTDKIGDRSGFKLWKHRVVTNGMRIPLCKRIGPQCGDATLAPLDTHPVFESEIGIELNGGQPEQLPQQRPTCVGVVMVPWKLVVRR